MRVLRLHGVGAARAGAASVRGAQPGISFYPEGICTTLEAWRARSPVTSLFGLDLLILVHESLHAGGLTDEEVTQCQAMRKLAEVAIRFFGFKPRSPEIRKLVRLAYVRSSAIPSAC